MKRNGLLTRLALLLLAGAIAPGAAAPAATALAARMPAPDTAPSPVHPATASRPPLAAARLGLHSAAPLALSLNRLAPAPGLSLALVGMR